MKGRLKALNGNYKATIKNFDEGKAASTPMSSVMHQIYKSYPYRVARYSTFSWFCVTMSASQEGVDATQVSTSPYVISSKTKHRNAAWKFSELLCTDEKVQQFVFNYFRGSPVLKSAMRSQATEDKLKEDGSGSESSTISTLNSMLSQGVARSTFKTYNSMMNQMDHAISKSLANNNTDSDLPTIQKEIGNSLKQKRKSGKSYSRLFSYFLKTTIVIFNVAIVIIMK